jgi:hypothetical protein
MSMHLGCASTTVETDRAEGVDFAAYRTFAVAPPPGPTQNLVGYSEIHGERIQKALVEAFTAKGYDLKDREEADLLVAFGVSGKPRTDIWSDRAIAGPGWYGSGTMVHSVHYLVGTLTVDVFDIADQRLIWHGWAQKEFFEDERDRGEAPEAARSIVKTFPARPAPAE